MADVQPARGMRDFIPDKKRRREDIIKIIKSTYESFGYKEIETPALENLAILDSGQGGENDKMLFKVMRRGLPKDVPILPDVATDLGLRFDLTLPLARFYASNRVALPKVFRSIQIAPVWRAERPQKGRFRQFMQCDIDIIGEAKPLAEVELIIGTLTALARLGINDPVLRLNDRRILIGLLDAFGFAESSFGAALITIDKLDKIQLDGVESELQKKDIAAPDQVAQLMSLLKSFAALGDSPSFDEVTTILPSKISPDVILELRNIESDVKRILPDTKSLFDISLVRGMGYYTGPIFELTHQSTASSIAGGGRYDRMIGRFLKEEVPACGFSIGFDRIVELATIDSSRAAQRTALVYELGIAYGDLVQAQQELLRGGAEEVLLVERPKRMGNLFEHLRRDGYTEVRSMSLTSDGAQLGVPQLLTAVE